MMTETAYEDPHLTVPLQVVLVVGPEITVVALERFLSSVNHGMPRERVPVLFATCLTRTWNLRQR